jgi:hypothetical protein
MTSHAQKGWEAYHCSFNPVAYNEIFTLRRPLREFSTAYAASTRLFAASHFPPRCHLLLAYPVWR